MKRYLKVGASLFMALLMTLAMVSNIFADDFFDYAKMKEAKLSVNAVEGAEYTAYQIMRAQKLDTEGMYSYVLNTEFKEFFDGSRGYKLSKDNEILIEGKDKDGKDAWVPLNGDSRWTNTNTSNAAKLATALQNYVDEKNMSGFTVTAKPTSLMGGFYLVLETKSPKNEKITDEGGKTAYIASKPILVNLTEDTVITPKADKIPLDKVILEGDKPVDSNNANIGDTIKYQVTSAIPTYEANVDKDKLTYTFTDTFAQIAFDEDSMVVKVGESTLVRDKDYVLTSTAYDKDTAKSSFVLKLNKETIFENQGKTVTLTYSGVLTKDAIVSHTVGNINIVKLTYTNNPGLEKSEDELQDEVTTYTYEFKIHKVDKNNNDAIMKDATFKLENSKGDVIGVFKYDENGAVVVVSGFDEPVSGDEKKDKPRVISDTENGKNYAVIRGLDADTYTITEMAAPSGYSKLAEPVKIKIEDVGEIERGKPDGRAKITLLSDNATLEGEEVGVKVVEAAKKGNINAIIKIENVKGVSLPETGSVTMVLCLAGGAIAILLSVIYLALSRKREKDK